MRMLAPATRARSMATALLAAALTATPAARAQDCDRLATQAEMGRCAADRYKAADQKLNQAYQALRGRLSAQQKEMLKASQTAWIRFRDLECEFSVSGAGGGSIGPMLTAQCLAQRTEQRSRELLAHANCKEGDMSCPSAPR
jgi:uncharacterized protein YecT (DUF1311 family)